MTTNVLKIILVVIAIILAFAWHGSFGLPISLLLIGLAVLLTP